jgi:hypothetical protein
VLRVGGLRATGTLIRRVYFRMDNKVKFKPTGWLVMEKRPITDRSIWPSFLKVALLCGFVSVSGSVQAQVSDRPIREAEAQRLDAVRALISQEKSLRLSKYILSSRTAAFCETMRTDLLNHKGFQPIEPIAILNADYPERNIDMPEDVRARRDAVVDKKLGPVLSDGIKRCSKMEADGDLRKGQALFNGFNEFFGLPPFRVYTLPAKKNPFKDSKLIYWSEYSEKLGSGRRGYSWVNLNICEHTNGLTITYSDSTLLKSDPAGQKSVLTRYRDKIVSWYVSRNFYFEAAYIDFGRKNMVTPPFTCGWQRTYPETPVSQ